MSAAPTTAEWFRAAVHRVSRGSSIVALRLTGRGAKAATHRASRWQDGIRGWLAESSGGLDTLLRWVLLAICARIAWALLRGVPGIGAHLLDRGRWLLWPAAVVFVIAAYRAGDPDATEPEAQPEPDTLLEEGAVALALFGERDLLLLALAEILGDRAGIHVWQLYAQLRQRPHYADLDDKQMRKLLDLHGVTVHKSMTADKVSGRSGIKRADVLALLAPPPQEGAPLSPGETGRDLRESRSLSDPEAAPEGDSCTAHELGDDTLAMLREVS